MASLYKRANERQRRVLRMVEGAVKNAADAHPEVKLPKSFARSVAKRAAGTMTAAWPALLATGKARPSDSANGDTRGRNAQPGLSTLAEADREVAIGQPAAPARHLSSRRGFLRFIKNRIGARAGEARRAGNGERALALADACRIIAELESAE